MRLREFAPAGGGGSGDYFQALASAWYNGVFDTGSLQKGIKSQEDVERLLNRGIVCPDGKTRKLHIDYNSDFDGVEIYSDDYYNHGDESGELDSRTGQPWGPYDFMEFKDEELDEGVTEGVNDYLWHGSKSKHDILYPQQANDTGGKKESNKNAIYATPSAKVAIAMGLTTPGSDTGMFPNDPQMVLFKGGIRKGEMVYLHKVPKDLFIKHNDREWYSKPGVKEVKPIEVVTVPVDKYLNLIRQATPQDLELQKKNMKKQGVAEGSLNEFAPNDGGEGGEEDILHKYARMWWAGNEATQMQIERALAKMGWEIGEDEGSYDNGGVFVVRAGDINGRSYQSWPAEELDEGMWDAVKKSFTPDPNWQKRAGQAAAHVAQGAVAGAAHGHAVGHAMADTGVHEGDDPWGSQGRYVGDTGPAQLTTTVAKVQLKPGDQVLYKPTEQRARIEALSRDGAQARIHIATPMGGRTFNCKTSDLKALNRGLAEVAPPGDKAERMVKHIKKGYAKDGKLSPKEKSIAYATAWKGHKNGLVESRNLCNVCGQTPCNCTH